MAAPTRFRWLLHIDLDQFQVSVERLRRDDLDGIPVVVGGDGDPSRARQVVTCASYEAREFGVRAGLPLPAARRKCPDAVFLPLDMPHYEAASEHVMNVIRGFGHPVEVWGWDEGYFGIAPRDGQAGPDHDGVAGIARTVRDAVAAEAGLNCCLGISDNKQRAKMATGFAKEAIRESGSTPDQRIFTLDDSNWGVLMGPRPCRDLWSVGPKTAAKLSRQGVDTVDQLADVDRDDLVAAFGPSQGNWLYVLCRGGGDDSIAVDPRIAKSHSKSRTYPSDLVGRDDMRSAVADLTREVIDQSVTEGRVPFRVGLTVRTSTFYTRTKMRKLAVATTAFDEVVGVAWDLLDAFDVQRPVRLLAVRLEFLDVEADAEAR